MKITIIRHSIRNRGGDRVVLDYASHLAQHGHEIEYWTNEINTKFSINPTITIKQIPYKGVLGTIWFTVSTKFNTDIILVDLILMACKAWTRNPGKVIYLAQDYNVTYHKSLIIKGLLHIEYWLGLNIFGIPTASVADGLTEILQKYKPKKLITIPNGVDLDLFQRTSDSQNPTDQSSPFRIVFFARDDYRKGLDTAINTFKELKKIRPQDDWEVLTVGEETVEIDGVVIRNLGFLSTYEEVRDVLNEADIYLCPSRSEGLSLLLLQSLACECAIVSTEASHILENEKNALLSPIEDFKKLAANLNRVLSDKSLRDRLKSEARPLAEQYSLEKSITKLEKLINENLR